MQQLPLDILIHTLSLLPALPSSDSSVFVLSCFLQSSRLLREAASISSLWEPHYRSRYLHCNERDESLRNSRTNGDWKLMYFERRRIDHDALDLLGKIVSRRDDQLDNIRRLFNLSFDIWDALRIEAEQPLPAILGLAVNDVFTPRSDHAKVAPYAVTRRYWASSILEAISRSYAIQLWDREQRGDDSISFVESFSALSCFCGISPVQMKSLLDTLICQCQTYLSDKKCIVDPGEPGYDLVDLCVNICHFMEKEGFGPAEVQAFHSLNNIYPHKYLTTNRKSIPISLVHVFVGLARGIGIPASPVDFPKRVLAHIKSSKANEEDFYVDVFGAREKAILTIRDDIVGLLARSGILPQAMDSLMIPSQAPPMLLRTSRNIMASVHTHTNPFRDPANIPLYLAFTLYLLFTTGGHFASRVSGYMGLVDSVTVLPLSLTPIFTKEGPIRTHFEDVYRSMVQGHKRSARISRRSDPDNHRVKYSVGMFFKHKQFKYIACINSWDNTCKMDEKWIEEMGVHRLPSGSDQPFYLSFAIDGTERYVAEDNIVPINLEVDDAAKFFSVVQTMPAHFSDIEIDKDGHAQLVLSPALMRVFPEDKAMTGDPSFPRQVQVKENGELV